MGRSGAFPGRAHMQSTHAGVIETHFFTFRAGPQKSVQKSSFGLPFEDLLAQMSLQIGVLRVPKKGKKKETPKGKHVSTAVDFGSTGDAPLLRVRQQQKSEMGRNRSRADPSPDSGSVRLCFCGCLCFVAVIAVAVLSVLLLLLLLLLLFCLQPLFKRRI